MPREGGGPPYAGDQLVLSHVYRSTYAYPWGVGVGVAGRSLGWETGLEMRIQDIRQGRISEDLVCFLC